MKILIVAPFASLPDEPYFNRFLYLANRLAAAHDVTLLTSQFRHFDKSFRLNDFYKENFDIKLIRETGYRKNISLMRIFSHWQFSINFAKWFKEAQKEIHYDLVYSAFPLIGHNIFLAKYKKKYGYRLILDIQDVWPEAISSALPMMGIIPDRLVPLSWRADAAYRGADALVAVSQTYLSRALVVNKKAPSLVTYIGSDVALIDSIAPLSCLGSGVHFLYVGTLSHSYDMQTVIDGFRQFLTKQNKFVLHILGDGPDAEKLKRSAPGNVKFHGFLPYKEMVAFAKSCDVFINPIKKSAKQSITNKLSDYVVLNRVVVTSQTNAEARHILSSIPSIDFESGNVSSFVSAAEIAARMEIKNDRETEEGIRKQFDREYAYSKLVNFIELVAHDE